MAAIVFIHFFNDQFKITFFCNKRLPKLKKNTQVFNPKLTEFFLSNILKKEKRFLNAGTSYEISISRA